MLNDLIVGRIRKLRKLRKINQQEMADNLGIDQKSYSNIETGKVRLTVDRLEAISKVFNIKPIEFFSDHHVITEFLQW